MRERQKMPVEQILLLLAAIVIMLFVLVTRPKPPETPTLAFVVESGQYSGTLFRVDADGSHLQQLAEHVRGSFAPTWSPDGEKLLYISDEKDLWVMDADGKKQHQLMQDAKISYQPAWSPDGKQILFISRNDIAVMNLDGSALRQITNQGNYETAHQDFGYTNVSWSPDGKYIAFEGYHRPSANGELFIVDAACTAADLCVNQFLFNTWGDEHTYDWSPDSRYFAFPSGRNGSRSRELYLMSMIDGSMQQLTNDLFGDGDPNWSPDGKKIIFLSSSDDGSERFIRLLYIDGHEGWTLPIENVSQLSWSPDSQFFAYSVGQTVYIRDAFNMDVSSSFDMPNIDTQTIAWRP
jgi:TolB protein